MSMSRFILNLALRHVPPARAEWAEAMRSEFEVLETGRLSWALGCLRASLGWELTANALYWLALPLFVLLAEQILSSPFFWMAHALCPMGTWYCDGVIHLGDNLPFMLVCLSLGIWRPDRIATTTLVATVSLLIHIYLFFALVMHGPLGTTYVHIMKLPPVAGEFVLLTIGWVATAAGAVAGRSVRRVVFRRP